MVSIRLIYPLIVLLHIDLFPYDFFENDSSTSSFPLGQFLHQTKARKLTGNENVADMSDGNSCIVFICPMWTRPDHWDAVAYITSLITHPVASEHRWYVKAPWWIHSVPDVSGRRSWPCAIVESPWRYKHLPFANIASSRSRSIKRRQWKHKLQIGLLWHCFCSSSYLVWD